ncbi:MAG: hypothetical protein D6B25_01940 [Desulfobulbaceae bacterium]|nr:MAG: hypothetical protein D6B25_01940 [Desulfobulbaceae bacterium]
MSANVKYYKLNDFIKLNKSGEIDLQESLELVHSLVRAVTFIPRSYILVDLRETWLKNISMNEILKLAAEIYKHQTVLRTKIPNFVPDDPARLEIAGYFRSAMNLSGFDYEFFTESLTMH